jgi:hypothetical protein
MNTTGRAGIQQTRARNRHCLQLWRLAASMDSQEFCGVDKPANAGLDVLRHRVRLTNDGIRAVLHRPYRYAIRNQLVQP